MYSYNECAALLKIHYNNKFIKKCVNWAFEF